MQGTVGLEPSLRGNSESQKRIKSTNSRIIFKQHTPRQKLGSYQERSKVIQLLGLSPLPARHPPHPKLTSNLSHEREGS